MLSFSMFRPYPTLPRPNRSSTATLFFGKSSSSFDVPFSTLKWVSLTPFPATLTSTLQITEKPASLSPAFATLTSRVKHKSCVCHSYKKHPGWGVPSFSANSVPAALKSTHASAPDDPFDALHRSSASALESTATQRSATIASKELTPMLNPLDATLTKNRREGPPQGTLSTLVYPPWRVTRRC
jgi:hypothetical protein